MDRGHLRGTGQPQPLVDEGDPADERDRIQGTGPLGQLNLTTEVENFPGFPAGDLEGYLEQRHQPGRRAIMPPHSKHGQRPGVDGANPQQAANFGTRIVSKDVVKVDLQRHPFMLTAVNRGSDDRVLDGTEDTVEAEAVIVATGGSKLPGLGVGRLYKNRGVSACAVCDGALPRFRNKPLVVVGGGDSAVEEATYLTKFAHPGVHGPAADLFRASKIMVERALLNRRIVTKYNRVVDEVLGDAKQGVTGVRLTSTTAAARNAGGVWNVPGNRPHAERRFPGRPDGTERQGATSSGRRRSEPSRAWTASSRRATWPTITQEAVTAAGSGCMAALDAERRPAAKVRIEIALTLVGCRSGGFVYVEFVFRPAGCVPTH